jgi:6-phosphogluconolactonase/glucosamine-6-phosphate isomerase/deaminase
MQAQTSERKMIAARREKHNLWLQRRENEALHASTGDFFYNVLENETAVGEAMFNELRRYTEKKTGDVVVVLLGGRGAQAMYRIIAEKATTGEIDEMLSRLHVFTQDALAPMRPSNSLNFVRDFERLLGNAFFQKVKSFTSMPTDAADPECELVGYLKKIDDLGGIDIFFLGLGPEADGASHLCYIKPGSGARQDDLAGIIPVSPGILEHHISKFKAGGSTVSPEDEDECRRATHILTLGPAAILGAKKVVQSIVDASTAPSKRESFATLINTQISADAKRRAKQMDENPGLWIRLHPNVTSFVLPDLF